MIPYRGSFFILRPEEVQDMLVNILAQMVTAAGKRLDEYLYKNEELDCYIRDVIAADGKETHNTGKKKSEDAAERRNLQEFNVMSTEWGISLSSTRIDEKSNEIPQMQKVMKQIDCRGCIVTADAMNAQKATAEAIIKQARGDYCLALKGNHGTVWREVKEYFACEELLEKIKKKRGSISGKRKREPMKRSQGNTSSQTAWNGLKTGKSGKNCSP